VNEKRKRVNAGIVRYRLEMAFYTTGSVIGLAYLGYVLHHIFG